MAAVEEYLSHSDCLLALSAACSQRVFCPLLSLAGLVCPLLLLDNIVVRPLLSLTVIVRPLLSVAPTHSCRFLWQPLLAVHCPHCRHVDVAVPRSSHALSTAIALQSVVGSGAVPTVVVVVVAAPTTIPPPYLKADCCIISCHCLLDQRCCSHRLPTLTNLPTGAAEGGDKDEALAAISAAPWQHRREVVGGASEQGNFVILVVIFFNIVFLHARLTATKKSTNGNIITARTI